VVQLGGGYYGLLSGFAVFGVQCHRVDGDAWRHCKASSKLGKVLWGGGLIGIAGGGSATNTTVVSCTPVGGGTLPCGANVGDQLCLKLNRRRFLAWISSARYRPPANQIGNSTTSPIRAWDAVCDWVGNGSQCNGWLLKRDVDPASNDNDPMWLEKAA
jgi:hypothetical protein